MAIPHHSQCPTGLFGVKLLIDMSKTHRHGAVARAMYRTGEGTPIDVVQHSVVKPDGTGVAVLGINLAQAPVPERRYVADVGTVSFESGTIKVMFGQRKLSSEALRSLVVIHMSPNAVAQFLDSVKGMEKPSLDEIGQKIGIEPEVLAKAFSEEPEQTVAFAANIVAVAVAAKESCLDFYQASSFSIAGAVSSKKLPVDAVVRVDLRTSLFMGVVKELQKIASKFPHEATEEQTQ